MSTEIENGGGAPATATTLENNSTNPVNTVSTESNGSGASKDWREALGEEYRSHKSIKDYKSVNDLVKSHLNLEKMLGAKQPSLVGEESKTVYEPDAYKYSAEEGKPEVIPEIFDKVSAKAAALQIPPAHFQELVNEFLGAETEVMGQSKAAEAIAVKEAETSLKTEWGANYEQNIDNAHKAFELFATPELKEEVSNLPVSVKTSITKMMSNIYSKIGETTHGKEGGQKNNLTPEQANAKIADIRNDLKHPYHTGDIAAKAEMTRLYLAASGN